jgi:RHS repeat-associated protein
LTNQTVTKGTAPSLNVSYNPATNRQTGECADANGNLNSASVCNGSGGVYYDVENRIVRSPGDLAWAYSYAPGNKRVWRGQWDTNGTQTTDEITYWSATGQKLATYQLSAYGTQLVATATGTNQYFGGKLIKNSTGYVTPDRLGSIGKYFPYGQERPSATTDGKEKFATYFRDSETGLDYANNRYHQPGMGRFMTPDPARSGLNWYAYAGGDPVNNSDPTGLDGIGPIGADPCDISNGLAYNNGGGYQQLCLGTLGQGGPINPIGLALSGSCGICSFGSVVPSVGLPDSGSSSGGSGPGFFQQVGSFFGKLLGLGGTPDVYSVFLPDGGDSNAIRLAAGIDHMNPGGFVNGFAVASVAAGTAVGSGLVLAGGSAVTAPSILYGDIQTSFNFGASFQPVITNTINVSRVFGPTGVAGQSQMVGPWFTTEVITSSSQATSSLALGAYNLATQIVQGTILPGANIVIGTAAAQSGQPGGGFQVFVNPPLSSVINLVPVP